MDFIKAKEEFFNRLGDNCYMVLATSYNDYPMASTMTCFVYDDAIWMQTDKNFPKYDQILKNKQVALCKYATQIEGIAEICGHPLDKGNEKFIEYIKKYNPESYKMYSYIKSEVIIKVTPIKVIDWRYEKGDKNIYHLDFKNQKVEVEIYEK